MRELSSFSRPFSDLSGKPVILMLVILLNHQAKLVQCDTSSFYNSRPSVARPWQPTTIHYSSSSFHYPSRFPLLKRQEEGQGQHEQLPNKDAKPMELPENPENATSEQHTMKKPNSSDEALESLTSPDKLVPVINNLTLIALLILHLPAAVPTVFIPLAFYCVGALLIPIVRVNYFINHKDDGEDGRRSIWA